MKHKIKKIHFVGIGGSGMSGIAEVLLNLGFQISGSDLVDGTTTRRLRSLGAKVYLCHAAQNIEHADVVVVSTAVPQQNAEVVAAKERGIPVVPRALMLSELLRLKRGIAIAGTHGKTTTTSLVASILAKAGMDPTFVIGGKLVSAGAHAKLGSGEFIVVEADESDASFLYLQPVLTVVTNIDADHMETYDHSFDKLKQAFVDFIHHLPFYGRAVLCIDDPQLRALLPNISKPITTYGLSEDAQLRAENVEHCSGRMRFLVIKPKNGSSSTLSKVEVNLNLPGLHNVRNALAAFAVANELGIADDIIVKALAEFKGVGRRFQKHGEIQLPQGGAFTLIEDYGHHPTEIAATMEAIRGAYPGRRVILAFQPHRYTRTRDVFEDFVKALSTPDVLLLTEVYAAGETPIVAADGRTLSRAIRVFGKVEPIFVEHIEELAKTTINVALANDVVVLMGAGSIGSVVNALAIEPRRKLRLHK